MTREDVHNMLVSLQDDIGTNISWSLFNSKFKISYIAAEYPHVSEEQATIHQEYSGLDVACVYYMLTRIT